MRYPLRAFQNSVGGHANTIVGWDQQPMWRISIKTRRALLTCSFMENNVRLMAYDQVVMLKNLRCPARVVWVFRETRWAPCVRIVVASNFYLEEAKNESEIYRRI